MLLPEGSRGEFVPSPFQGTKGTLVIGAESLEELCPAGMWEVKLVSDELGYFIEEISCRS